MTDLLGMIGAAKSPQDEALAKELIRSMLGAAATPRPAGEQPFSFTGQQAPAPVQQQAAPQDPFSSIIAQANSPQDQALAVELIRSMLGGGAAPRTQPAFQFQQDPNQSAAETARLQSAKAVSANAAAADTGSRLAAVLDAQSLELPGSSGASGGGGDGAAGGMGEAPKAKSGDKGNVLESVNEAGIAKIKQANGTYLFTNVKDANGNYTSDYMGETPKGHSPVGKPVSANIQEQLSNIRASTDSASAQVLASSLNASLTAEYTRMENDAYTMAAQKLGVPTIQRALVAQQSYDAQQRAYNPAMGESPETARLRAQLNSAEQQAQSQSKNWLGNNLGYNQLKATEADAKIAVEIAVKKAAAQEDRNQNKLYDAELKQATKRESAAQAAASIAPTQRALAVRLNPALRISDKEDVDSKNIELVHYVDRQLKSNKNFQALWQAEPAEYPSMAFSGNPLAKDLLLQDESMATGISEQELGQEFDAYSKMPVTDADVRGYAMKTLGGASPKEKEAAVNEFMSTYQQAKLSSSSSALKQRASLDAVMKVSRVRAARQARLTGDVMTWAPQGSALSEAAIKAKGITGKADLSSTLAEMTKEKPLAEQISIYKEVRQELLNAASKYDKSSYGAIDSGELINTFNSTAINMAQLTDTLRTVLRNIPTLPFTGGSIAGKGNVLSTGYDAYQAKMYQDILK